MQELRAESMKEKFNDVVYDKSLFVNEHQIVMILFSMRRVATIGGFDTVDGNYWSGRKKFFLGWVLVCFVSKRSLVVEWISASVPNYCNIDPAIMSARQGLRNLLLVY